MPALLLLVEDLELYVFPDKSINEVFYNDRLSALAPHRYIPQKLGVSLFSEGGSVLVMKVTGWKPRSGDPVSNPQPIDDEFLIEEQIMPDYENVITD